MQCTHSTVCELDKSSFFTETLILTFIFPTFPRISKILTYQKCWKISTKGLIWIFAPKSKKLSETLDAWIFMLKIMKDVIFSAKIQILIGLLAISAENPKNEAFYRILGYFEIDWFFKRKNTLWILCSFVFSLKCSECFLGNLLLPSS